MFFVFDVPWYRVVAIVALTWLAAAGPMQAFSTPLVGRRTINLSSADRATRVVHDAKSQDSSQAK
jgi:hypothetical protein